MRKIKVKQFNLALHEEKKKFIRIFNLCKTCGRARIRIWTGLRREIRIRIGIGINTMPMHNSALNTVFIFTWSTDVLDLLFISIL